MSDINTKSEGGGATGATIGEFIEGDQRTALFVGQKVGDAIRESLQDVKGEGALDEADPISLAQQIKEVIDGYTGESLVTLIADIKNTPKES